MTDGLYSTYPRCDMYLNFFNAIVLHLELYHN